MTLFYIISLGLAVSIDSFAAGMAYGIKTIRMPFTSLCVIGVITGLCTTTAIVLAHLLGNLVNLQFAVGLGAILLVLLGLFSIFKEYLSTDTPQTEFSQETLPPKLTFSAGRLVVYIMSEPEAADIDLSKVISPIEACFLGLALGFDNMVAAFSATLMNILPFYVPVLMAVIQMGLVSAGVYASNLLIPDSLKCRFNYIPGIILVLLGLLRLG